MGLEIAVHVAALIWMHNGIIRSIPMSARTSANPEITTNEAQPLAGPHFSCKCLVHHAMSRDLPLSLLNDMVVRAQLPHSWPDSATRPSAQGKTPRHWYRPNLGWDAFQH